MSSYLFCLNIATVLLIKVHLALCQIFLNCPQMAPDRTAQSHRGPAGVCDGCVHVPTLSAPTWELAK